MADDRYYEAEATLAAPTVRSCSDVYILRTYIHAYMHTYIHTNVRIYIHTYTHPIDTLVCHEGSRMWNNMWNKYTNLQRKIL